MRRSRHSRRGGGEGRPKSKPPRRQISGHALSGRTGAARSRPRRPRLCRIIGTLERPCWRLGRGGSRTVSFRASRLSLERSSLSTPFRCLAGPDLTKSTTLSGFEKASVAGGHRPQVPCWAWSPGIGRQDAQLPAQSELLTAPLDPQRDHKLQARFPLSATNLLQIIGAAQSWSWIQEWKYLTRSTNRPKLWMLSASRKEAVSGSTLTGSRVDQPWLP